MCLNDRGAWNLITILKELHQWGVVWDIHWSRELRGEYHKDKWEAQARLALHNTYNTTTIYRQILILKWDGHGETISIGLPNIHFLS